MATAVTTRRGAFAAIAGIATVGILAGGAASASPDSDRAAWDKAWREYQDATAAYRADCVNFDRIDLAHSADLPSRDMIDWREFPMRNPFEVTHVMDMDAYRARVIAERGRTWNGTDAALARRMDAIESVIRYREAVEQCHQRHDWSAACDRNEALCDAMCAAENRLIEELPAPDLAALHWKLGKLLDSEGGRSTPTWEASYVAQTVADMRRLLGGEA